MTTEAALATFFASRPEVLEAYVFGSTARNDTRPDSDLDLAVYIDRSAPTPPLGHQVELLTELTAIAKTEAVDLVILNHATPLLYHRVLRDGRRLYAKDLAASSLREAAALSRYADDIVRLEQVRAAFSPPPAKGAV